jgi:hypothetical protein
MSSLEHPRITEVGRLLAENDRLRGEALAEYEYACIERDRLRTDIKQIEAENDRLREALAIFADWYQTHPDATLPLGLHRADFSLARTALAKEAGKSPADKWEEEIQ